MSATRRVREMDPNEVALRAAQRQQQDLMNANPRDLENAIPGGVIRIHDPDRSWFMREAKRENRRNQRIDFLIGCSILAGGLIWAGVGAGVFVLICIGIARLVMP